MTFVDWTLLAIIGLSSLISLTRGFVKEALSVSGWVIAGIVSYIFYKPLAAQLTELVTVPMLRPVASAAMLFIGTLMVMSVINFLVGRLVKSTGLSGTDRALGVAFGFVRGILICIALMGIMVPVFKVDRMAAWKQSVFVPYVQVMGKGVKGVLSKFSGATEGLKDKIDEKKADVEDSMMQDNMSPEGAR